MPPQRGLFIWWGCGYRYFAPTALDACLRGKRRGPGVSPSPVRGDIFVAAHPKIIFKLRQERHLRRNANPPPPATHAGGVVFEAM